MPRYQVEVRGDSGVRRLAAPSLHQAQELRRWLEGRGYALVAITVEEPARGGWLGRLWSLLTRRLA